jgi:molybdopterin synthase catalytic subunit
MLKIVEQKIDVQEVIDSVLSPECGAVAVFIGTVRNNSNGKRVTGILYEGYRSMAEKTLNMIAGEISKKWKPSRVSIVHRIGKLKVGEPSVVIAVGTPHRKEAFEACRFAIEEIKKQLPVWKQEFYKNGKGWVRGKRLR